MKKIDEVIQNYHISLIIEHILLEEESKLTIKQQENFYLSIPFLSALKRFIQTDVNRSFIDTSICRRLLDYCTLFREIYLESKKYNPIILQLINECIIECNQLNPKNNFDLYLVEQVYIRIDGYYKIDSCYVAIQNKKIREQFLNSILKDLYMFNHYVYKDISILDGHLLYDEMAIWSANRFLYDIEQLKTHPTFTSNCEELITTGNNLLLNCLKNGIVDTHRIRKEKRSLAKKIR